MKHKVLLGAVIATLLAFILYTASLKRVENAKLKIVEPNSSKAVKSKKKAKEPKVNSIEYSNHVTAKSGSNKQLVKKIKQIMGIDNSYQVAVQDLTNSSRYAVVANTSKAHEADKTTMQLFLLIALYEQEQSGKMGSKTAIKIHKSDKVKGDKMFQVNIDYGISYLRSALLKGNKTAANALIRKIGAKNINSIAKKMGATQTTVKSNLTGTTTANDLVKTMVGLYQGRVLNRQYASRVLALLAKNRPALVKGLSGGIYATGSDDFNAAIVQDNGHAYCMSVWSSQHKNFNKLGKTVSSYFSSKKK